MQLEVISREIIKPSSSSPNNHPKIHNLSFVSQIAAHFYVPYLFFYTDKNGETDEHRSSLLKASFSNVLSKYYPVAGRIKDNKFVECNDYGLAFIEAKINCELSQILKDPQDEPLKLLVPENQAFADSIPTGPLIIQVTYFKCGGMSLGVCMCHKFFDMSCFCVFMNDWASLARTSTRGVNPEFNIGSLFPPLDLPFLKQKQLLPPRMADCATRRLVFSGEKIAKLKEKVGDVVDKPTRANVVTALLYKTLVKAAAKASPSGSIKPSVFKNAVNDLRAMVSPPISKRNIGNLAYVFSVMVREDWELEMGYLVKEYRKSRSEFSNSFSSKEELVALMLKSFESAVELSNVEHEVYVCSDCCSFPVYEADFGWGKPIWFAMKNLKNLITLYDTRQGDGIEVFMSLEEQVMDVFQQDEELLSFCRINPSVVNLESCP